MTPIDRNIETEVRIAIARIGGQKILAHKLGISDSELTRKLNGERGWRLGELEGLFDICDLEISKSAKDEDELDVVYVLSKKLTETLRELRELKKKGGNVK